MRILTHFVLFPFASAFGPFMQFFIAPHGSIGTMKAASLSSNLCEPSEREMYGSNLAQYLIDLHDARATFDFCGGMMFQLVLTNQLREHLRNVASKNMKENSLQQQQQQQQQPVLFDASRPRMHLIPEYEPSAKADNVRIFHGREIRQVPDATGGMGMVLQLSLARTTTAEAENDPEGWTSAEFNGYDGWKHDVGRVWRNGDRLEEEGFAGFKKKFGDEAYTLNHRFYLHLDRSGSLWLAAEDGCEGTPATSPRSRNVLSALFG